MNKKEDNPTQQKLKGKDQIDEDIDEDLPYLIEKCNQEGKDLKKMLKEVVFKMEKILNLEILGHLRNKHGIRESWEDNWLETQMSVWEDRWSLVQWESKNSTQKVNKWYEQNKCPDCKNWHKHKQLWNDLNMKKTKQDQMIRERYMKEMERKKREEEIRKKEMEDNDINLLSHK